MPSGVYIKTDEHKKKLSEANKGKYHTNEQKRKISEGNRGKRPSKEAKIKMSEAKKGKKLSEEHKQRISEANKGKHFTCKDGITPITKLIRASRKYKQWRQDVFIRDNFTCQKCGQVGGKLSAHHKKSFSELLREIKTYLPLLPIYEATMIYTPMWDVNNGTTFCEKCHKLTKNYKGRANRLVDKLWQV